MTFEVVKIGWYEMYTEEEIETLYHEFIASIVPELKHNSETWKCFECDLPATDIDWMSIYSQGEEIFNRCKIIISPGCKKCVRKMQKWSPKIAEEHNQNSSSSVANTFPRPDGMSGGLSGTCLTCRNEDTAVPEFHMSRCGKCKLVRYCSAACQKEDWARHKTICRKIQKVTRSERGKK
ncbi:hypothetical protein B0H11DRAFT_2036878 [Mycena galericulata]|nr:hypothetical protein B0H11DRAFT_2036878 [Mycena galericulata]